MTQTRSRARLGACLVLLLAVALLHLLPADAVPPEGIQDWVAHTVMGMVVATALFFTGQGDRAFQAGDAAIHASLLLAALEVAQAFVPGRTPSLGDLAADLAGVALAVAASAALARPGAA